MTTSSNNTDSTTQSTQTQTPTDDTSVDNYGYSHEEAEVETPVQSGADSETTEENDKSFSGYEENDKPADKVEDDKPNGEDENDKVDPSTGYDKEPEDKPADKVEDDKPNEENENQTEELTEEKVNELLGDLGDGYDVESISKFALDQKFTKEQLEAYVDFAKSQDQKNIEANQERVREQRKSWHEELKNDKDFSGQNGENFKKNVDRVEKVLHNFMPDTKKVLTDRGGMLPPYIMRDLLNVSRVMNPKDKLVNGDPSKPVEKEGNFLDEMYE